MIRVNPSHEFVIRQVRALGGWVGASNYAKQLLLSATTPALPYNQAVVKAKEICQKENVNTRRQWLQIKPENRDGLPANPDKVYANKGWVDW